MTDIFDNIILCNNCDTKTQKSSVVKEGFNIRFLECPKCHEKIYHPLDLKNYQDFQTLKNKKFQVKLRLVGNSYAVSIPKEIIDFIRFEEAVKKEMDRMIDMSLEEPCKLSIIFSKFFKE